MGYIVVTLTFISATAIGGATTLPDGNNIDALSPAIGLQTSQIQSDYPNLDCSNNLCDFGKGATPQRVCPRAGPCDNLTLYVRDGRVIGYQADFSTRDWAKSLAASTTLLGAAKRTVIGPLRLVSIRSEFWSWRIAGQRDLTYTATSGTDIQGRLVDAHSISITPSGP